MKKIYIVNVSGGLSSYEAWRRTVDQFGTDCVIPVFADVQGDPGRDAHAAPPGTNWDGEDDDIYRFMADTERVMGQQIVRVKHPEGIGVWGAIFKAKAIVMNMPGGTFAPCTKLLKQQTLDAFVSDVQEKNPDSEIVQVIGLNWNEQHRVKKFQDRKGASAYFPLMEPPFVENCHIQKDLLALGVCAPQMYFDGFPHGNCGGACVKSGHANWALCLKSNPGRYAYNEEQEEWFRRDVNPNVSILKDRRGGTVKPLTLRSLRERIERGEIYDKYEFGGCGCFAQSPQVSMEETLFAS